MDSLEKKRLYSIIEFNLKKYRINGVEYRSNKTTKDPQGIQGLIMNDKNLKSWKQKPNEINIGGDKKYAIFETNLQLRDFLAQCIIDIFSGNESKGNYSKSNKRLYNIKPSNGSSIENKEKPFVVKKGNTEFKVTEDGVYVNGKKIG